MYASARHQGVDEALLAELPNYLDSDEFSDAEKAALRLADLMAGDHTQVNDEVFAELRKHYSEPQILEICWRIAMFIGYGRLLVTLGIESVGQSCALPHHG